MFPEQKKFAFIASIVFFLLIIELVRRRKLREEYSWAWLIIGGSILIPVLWYGLLVRITNLIGAVVPTTTLFIFAFLAVLMLCLFLSIKLSLLTNGLKKIAQEMALLKLEVDDQNRG